MSSPSQLSGRFLAGTYNYIRQLFICTRPTLHWPLCRQSPAIVLLLVPGQPAHALRLINAVNAIDPAGGLFGGGGATLGRGAGATLGLSFGSLLTPKFKSRTTRRPAPSFAAAQAGPGRRHHSCFGCRSWCVKINQCSWPFWRRNLHDILDGMAPAKDADGAYKINQCSHVCGPPSRWPLCHRH